MGWSAQYDRSPLTKNAWRMHIRVCMRLLNDGATALACSLYGPSLVNTLHARCLYRRLHETCCTLSLCMMISSLSALRCRSSTPL